MKLNKSKKCPRTIIDNKHILDCSEIFIEKQFDNFASSFFPKKSKNPLLTYSISFLHILSLIYSVIGLFMKPKYLLLYAVYMSLLFTSLVYHRNNCFLTLFKNHFTGSDLYPIHLKESTTTIILFVLIIYSLIAYIYPVLSLYNISNIILRLIYNYSEFISKMAIFIFVVTFILYSFFYLYRKELNSKKNKYF